MHSQAVAGAVDDAGSSLITVFKPVKKRLIGKSFDIIFTRQGLENAC